jgi:hypothetical protein
MARIRIEDMPAAENLSALEQEELFGAGRPSFRPSIESLEGRELYAANLGAALAPGLLPAGAAEGAALVQQHTPVNEIQVTGQGTESGMLGSASHAAQHAALDAALWGASSVTSAASPVGVMQAAGVTNNPTAAGAVHLNTDGTITVDTENGGYVIYRREADGWKQFGIARWEGNQWIEDAVYEDGTRVMNVWTKKDHAGVGSYDHVSQLVVGGGKATITRYHVNGAVYYTYTGKYFDPDATLRWVYSANASGTPNYNDLLEYHLKTFDDGNPYYNDWTKSGGWQMVVKPSRNSIPDAYVYTSSELTKPFAGKTVGVPPGTTVQEETYGKRIETVMSADGTHTRSR